MLVYSNTNSERTKKCDIGVILSNIFSYINKEIRRTSDKTYVFYMYMHLISRSEPKPNVVHIFAVRIEHTTLLKLNTIGNKLYPNLNVYI